MVMPMEASLAARRSAPFHIQLELDKKQSVPRDRGKTRIQGRAIRVFRSDGPLAIGDRIGFDLWVCREGDEPTGPAYIYFDETHRSNRVTKDEPLVHHLTGHDLFLPTLPPS